MDGSYLPSLEQSQGHQFLNPGVGRDWPGLNILVITESVESEAVWNLLPRLRFDATQDYFIGRPSESVEYISE